MVENDSDHPFVSCRECGGTMNRVSRENQSPLIMECLNCGHQEQALIQISPEGILDPVTAAEEEAPNHPEEPRSSQPFGAPVTVGDSEDAGAVIPFAWILMVAVLILAGLLWILW